jgi:PAS domain S-box-containing protein
MHSYHLALAATSVISAACAGFVFARDPRRRDGQMMALMLLGAAWWETCAVAWNLAPDATAARWWMRCSSPGWIFVGPMALHVFAGSGRRGAETVKRLRAVLYGASTVFLCLALTTNLILDDLLRTSWGWQYTIGPLFLPYAACTMIGVGWTLRMTLRSLDRDVSPAEERQRPWFLLACAIPITVSIATDIVLPMMGFRFPVLGAISFSAIGLVAVWSIHRYGHFLLSPGNFAAEILGTLPDGVLLVRADRSIRLANPALAQLSGQAQSELLGMPWTDLLTPVVARGIPGAESGEYELLCASGERIPVAVISSDLRDRQGNAIGMVLVVRDIRELKDLRTRVILSARLAAMGELAAGIAHEINNPMAFVRSNLSQLQTHWKTLCTELGDRIRELALSEIAGEGDELIGESIDGVDRAAEIVRGIRGFSHAGGADREAANLNQLIEEVLHLAVSQMQSSVTIERYYVELPPVPCAQQELKQVFLNLIVNAGHAVENGGTVRIATDAEGDWVVVRIKDDGEGIPPELIDRIFDPCFTTESVGKGTGLGLGIAYQIVQSHGGEIDVDSAPGEGTCFHVRLPAQRPESSPGGSAERT